MGRAEILEGFQGLIGLTLLEDTHGRVEQYDEQNQRRLEELLGMALVNSDAEADCGGQEQDKDHDVLELGQEALQEGFGLLLPQTIGSPVGQPLCRLGTAESLGAAVQLGQHLVLGHGMIGHRTASFDDGVGDYKNSIADFSSLSSSCSGVQPWVSFGEISYFPAKKMYLFTKLNRSPATLSRGGTKLWTRGRDALKHPQIVRIPP